MIQAKVIADSINPQGDRLTTFIVTFPRIILAEFNTHRMFSRNSASSRAIPFEKMVKSVQENPFIPIAWQKDHKGMQGSEYFTEYDTINWANIDGSINAQEGLKELWLESAAFALSCSKGLNAAGLTKQLCNRLLEPFMWHTVIITSGKEGLENFFNLRNHEAAEIHIQELAKKMLEVYNESTPKQLQAGEWHIPFGDNIDAIKLDSVFKVGKGPMNRLEAKIQIATARCARVSYTVVGEESKEPNYENDIKLHDKLLESGHFSPFEHCAKVMSNDEYYADFIKIENNKKKIGWCNNFKGFIQYRYLIENGHS